MVNVALICPPFGLIYAACSPSVNDFHLRIGYRCFNASCAAGVEKECMMGVSNRAAHAIDPENSDLLMPEKNRTLKAHRARDVEDACFEPVSTPRDVFSARPGAADASSSVFKSRITYPEADGPVPRDFAPKPVTQGERLDVFTARNNVTPARAVMSPAMVSALVVSAVAAVLAFWAADGQILQDDAELLTSRGSAPLAQVTDPVVVLPDPVVTSSVPVNKPNASAAGFTAPLPRPARIERAGSILMIRPAGD